MLRNRRRSVWTYVPLGLLALAALTSLSCSHSEKKSEALLEAGDILDLINEGQKRNDPRNDVEVDLGKFRVTHAVGEDDEVQLLVDFQLFGVLPAAKQAALEKALPNYNNRLRDAVIGLVQRIDIEHLTDPSLEFFKSELIAALNRVLQERLIKDVVFGDFSVLDAHSTPFPTESVGGGDDKKKKSSGGHGH